MRHRSPTVDPTSRPGGRTGVGRLVVALLLLFSWSLPAAPAVAAPGGAGSAAPTTRSADPALLPGAPLEREKAEAAQPPEPAAAWSGAGPSLLIPAAATLSVPAATPAARGRLPAGSALRPLPRPFDPRAPPLFPM